MFISSWRQLSNNLRHEHKDSYFTAEVVKLAFGLCLVALNWVWAAEIEIVFGWSHKVKQRLQILDIEAFLSFIGS